MTIDQSHIIDPMRDELQKLEQLENKLREDLDETRAKRRALEQAIRALTGERMTRSGGGAGTLLDKVRRIVEGRNDEFTATDITEQLLAENPDLSTKSSQVSSHMAHLRREGLLHVIGQRPNPSGGRPQYVYQTILDEEEDEGGAA